MSPIRNVFFDLDGTLVDPKDGITRCIQYSLNKMKRTCPDVNELVVFIGLPLRNSFEKLLNTSDRDQIEKAVALYRERYSTLGIYEQTVFPGVTELLVDLSRDIRLFIVTTKPTYYADIILQHFTLSRWFDGVFGTELDGRFDDKSKLIGHIFSKLELIPEETVMVGDRKEDVVAGKENGTRTIGVTYGYGSHSEIINAAPDRICNSVQEIDNTINNFE